MSWNDGWKATKFPGIWQQNGSYRVRVRAVVPATGKMREVNRIHEGITLKDAVVKQAELKAELQRGPLTKSERPRFSSYAVSLFARKITTGEITSQKTIDRWSSALELHLIPAFGDFFIDAISRADVEKQKETWAKLVSVEEDDEGYSPHTVNGWLSIFRVVIGTAVAELELERNPVALVKDLDTSTWHTYTEEEPNSLTPVEVPQFLATVRKLYPQHFAFIALGFLTGQRPSHLRPIRRSGATPDLNLEEGTLLIRRSETRGKVVERTKTKLRQKLALPSEMVEILREHIQVMEYRAESAQAKSELLFPSETGLYHAASFLDRPFRAVADALKLGKHITPRAMRRTFQDLMRAAEVKDVVTRSISGHLTQSMQEHYSTVALVEQREAMGKVIKLAGFGGARPASGDRGGDRGAEMKKAG